MAMFVLCAPVFFGNLCILSILLEFNFGFKVRMNKLCRELY